MSAKSRSSLFRAKLSQQILKAAKGFTLIELLVVIVIVGVLSAVAIPSFLNQVRRSRTAEAQAALTAVGRGSEVYRLENSIFPNSYADIKAAGPGSPSLYMNDPWSAPNYATPVGSAGNGTISGMIWDTTATGTAYKNKSGEALQCQIGLGDKETDAADSDFFVEKGCNVNK
jgi:type II secretion system protein G